MAKKKKKVVEIVDESGGVHALWAPSAADRWLNCPASVLESEGLKRKPAGDAAIEGTRVHKLGEDVLNGDIEIDTLEDDEAFDAVVMYTEEVERVYEGYDGDDIDFGVEGKLDLMHLIPEGSPDHWSMFGSADFWIDDPDGYSMPTIIDYKNGRGLVEVEGNPQLKLYAHALMVQLGRPIMGVRVGVVQPNAAHKDGPIRYVDVPIRELKEIGLAAKHALQNTHIKKAGSWCKWCPVQTGCKAKLKEVQEIATSEFSKEEFAPVPVKDLTDKQIAMVIANQKHVISWMAEVVADAATRVKKGKKIKGLKLVRNSGRSSWKSPEAFAEMVEDYGLKPVDMYKSTPIGIGDTKKLLKQMFDDKPEDLIADYVEKFEGSIAIVSEEDGRLAYSPAADEFAKED